MPSRGLIFINKSGSSASVSQSTHDERRAINRNSREQRAYSSINVWHPETIGNTNNKQRKRKSRNVVRRLEPVPFQTNPTDISGKSCSSLRDTEPKPNTKSSDNSTETPTDASSATVSSPTDSSSSTPSASISSATSDNDSALVGARRWSWPEDARKRSAVPSPPFTGGHLDPFSSGVIKVDAFVMTMLSYYAHRYHESLWKMPFGYHSTEGYVTGRNSRSVVGDCFTDIATMYATLANTACKLQFTERRNLPCHSSYFVRKATTAMRERLGSNEPLDQGTLVNVFHLGNAAFQSEDFQATILHFKGLGALVKTLGGPEAVDSQLMDRFALADSRVSAALCVDKIWPTYVSGAQGEESLRPVSLPLHLRQSVLLSPDRGDVVSPEMLDGITDLLATVDISERENADSSNNLNTIQRMNSLLLRGTAKLKSLNLQNSIHKCVADALHMWAWMINLTWDKSAGDCFAERTAERVREQIDALPRNSWIQHEDVLLWMCIAGAMAAAKGSETEIHFLKRILALQDRNGISPVLLEPMQEEAFRQLSERILWLDEVQRPMLRAMVGLLVNYQMTGRHRLQASSIGDSCTYSGTAALSVQ